MWKVLQAIVLFATAGLVIATRASNLFRLGDNPLVIAAFGLGITTMLMYRSLVSLLVMVLFSLLMALPDATLDSYGLDRDVLMACAIALLCVPWLQRLLRD